MCVYVPKVTWIVFSFGALYDPISDSSVSTSSTARGGGGSFKNRKPIGEIGSCESRMAEQKH